MINPPLPEGGEFALGGPSVTGPAPEIPPPPVMPNINATISEEEQRELVNLCNQFKRSVIDHATAKKEIMRKCFAYSRGQFTGENDLLPTLSSVEGGDKDANQGRPQVFMPVVREQVKSIYSQLKLMFFPNDEDYFRIRGKTEQAAFFENDLTAGYKWVFEQSNISEKLGLCLYDLIWGGFSAAYPCVKRVPKYEWVINQMTGQYDMTMTEGDPIFHVEAWNPLQFYPDPTATIPEQSRWGYFCRKKIQDLLDNDRIYMNTDLLEDMGDTQGRTYQDHSGANGHLYTFNGLQSEFQDTEKYIDYDLYYFPHLKLETGEYRNMIVGIAQEQTVVRFQPNLMPRGMNPAVWTDWMPDKDTPYGTGPVEDMMEIQRTVNLLLNYIIESAARNGNRWAATDDVDFSALWGVAGGVLKTGSKMPKDAVLPISGNLDEIPNLLNLMGTLKAEAQIVSGTQNPFQGSSNVDFKKTATELQILQENAISILREVVEHLSHFVQKAMERLMYLVADAYPAPIQIRVDDKFTGSNYITVDFSVVKQLPFNIEITSVNLAQSKMAMVNNLMQLLQLGSQDPRIFMQFRDNGYQLVKEIADLQGVKTIDKIMKTPNEMLQEQMQQMQMQQAQMNAAIQESTLDPALQGVPGTENGVGIDPNTGL